MAQPLRRATAPPPINRMKLLRGINGNFPQPNWKHRRTNRPANPQVSRRAPPSEIDRKPHRLARSIPEAPAAPPSGKLRPRFDAPSCATLACRQNKPGRARREAAVIGSSSPDATGQTRVIVQLHPRLTAKPRLVSACPRQIQPPSPLVTKHLPIPRDRLPSLPSSDPSGRSRARIRICFAGQATVSATDDNTEKANYFLNLVQVEV